MDIVVKKRKHVESQDNETSERNCAVTQEPHEIPVTGDQLFILGSTNIKCDSETSVPASFNEHVVCRRTQNARSTVVNETNLPLGKFTSTRRCGDEKIVSCKTDSKNGSLVDRLRNIKQQSFKRSTVGMSSLRDAQISANVFVESVRVLDDACNSTPTTRKSQNSARPLGLVPFAVVDRRDLEKRGSQKCSGTEHWSLEEDNEEDIFSDAKDDTENIGEFSQWQYGPAESPAKTFCGFSPGQIQSSREIVVLHSQRDRVEDENDYGNDDDTPALRGFPSVQIDTSEKLANEWRCRTENLCFNDSFGEDCIARYTRDTTRAAVIVDDCAGASRSGNSACSVGGRLTDRIPDAHREKARGLLNSVTTEMECITKERRDYCKPDDLTESKSGPKLSAYSASTCGFSTAGGRPISVSEAALAKAQIIYAEEIASVKNDSRDNCCSEGLPESKNSSKLATNASIVCGFSTASGRSINISEAAVMKAQRAYLELDDCEARSSNGKTPTGRSEETMDRGNAGVGFTTARGNRLKISAEALSKAKDLYMQEASIGNFTLASENCTSTTKRHDTGKGSLTVAAQLATDFDNIESINFDDFVDPVEDNRLSRKRKLDEVDEETPLRRDAYCKRKRGRCDNELQARKLFLEDSSIEDDAPTTKSKSEGAESTTGETFSPTVSPEKILISEEVDASAAALLEDEKRSNEGSLWKIKASSCTETESENFIPYESVNPKLTSAKSLQEIKRSCPMASPSNRTTRMERNSLDVQPESIPDDLTFDTQFSEDIQYSPVMDKLFHETMKIMEARLTMTCQQDETIRAKRRTKQQPFDGFLYKLRTSNSDSRISWKELTKGAAPAPREVSNASLEIDILSITATSAASYSFCCADLFGSKYVGTNAEGIKVGDDAFLILDENNRAGVREFERGFLAMPGVDPNLVPTGWVKNHYGWIVWKLASMDRVDFDRKCLPRMLTPDRGMFELKYRYDREIYRTQWPPLRRILERNEDASARIVLCVASITVSEENDNTPVRGSNTPNSLGGTLYKMKLTDGWYSIAACIDGAMVNCIKNGKVKEGTKLMTIGAKTLNLDQGCSALEIPDDVSLRIHTNSTRRVRWYTKLDYYHTNRGPMSLSLKSIKPNGGMICKLVVAVARLYPILYREKMPDGQFVFRNARRDEEAALAHESRHQSKMDEIYANARAEFQKSLANKKVHDKTRNRSSMEEVASSYLELEEEFRQRITSKLRECLPPPRDVTPVMKIRIAEGETTAILTVWSNDRDTAEIFVEGSSVAIYNASASRPRLNELQITASRSSFVKRETTRRIHYPERIFTSLVDIAEPGFNPVYGEFDTIGIVSSIGPAPHGMKNFETVNLACPRSTEGTASSFLSVLFWQGVSTHGYSKILTVGSLVACSNLEWRRNTVKSIPTAYCTERSIFSKNPRQHHLSEAFETLRGQIQEPFAYAGACAAVIEEEIAKKSAPRTPGNGTPYKPGTSSNLTPGWTPRDSRNSINANCTMGVDSKKASMKRRLEKLEAYGEPPKLPSIVINHSSRKVLSDFRSPVVIPVTKS